MKTKFAGLFSLILLCTQLQVFAGNIPVTVNEKLIKAFNTAFPMAEKVNWNETRDGYTVYFNDRSVDCMIEYDLEGRFVSSKRYYKDMSKLPVQLSWELHTKYPNKTVYGITELKTEMETVFFVKMEDTKEWMTLAGCANGILYTAERYNKQR